MAPNQPQPGAAPQPGGAAPQQLSPQQVQQMQLVVKQAMQMLLEDQTAAAIIEKCRQGEPAQVVADLVAPLLARINESAEGSGAQVDMVTMMVAGVQVIGSLAEMLWHADVIASEQEIPQFIAQAAKLAVAAHNASVGQQPQQTQQPQQPAAGGMLAQGV